MMKKLIAIILCLLLAVPALAEEMPGMRWTLTDFKAEMDGESASSALTVALDYAGGAGTFSVDLSGETLGAAHALFEPDGGAKLQMNDGDVFALSPEYMIENTCAGIANGELAQTVRKQGLFSMLSDFMAQLDAHEEDQFTLQISDLPEWTSGSVALAEMWMNLIGEELEIIPLNFKRDSLGYTMTADAEYRTSLTFRRSGERIMANLIIVGMAVEVYAAPDGGIDLNVNAGRYWYEGTEVYVMTARYQPQQDGSAKYSIVNQYQSNWTEQVDGYDNMYSRLNISGSVDAKGAHAASVSFSRDAENFSDMRFSFSVNGEPTRTAIPFSEKTAKKISKNSSSAAASLRKEFRDFRAAMKLLFSEPVLGETLTTLKMDPVTGAVWNAIIP